MFSRPSWTDDAREAFRVQVRRFVAEEVTPNEARWAKQQHVDRELWNKAGDLGLVLPDVPAEHGGAGGDFAHLAVVISWRVRRFAPRLLWSFLERVEGV